MAETSMPWVKLWTDFLDDPKIGPLADAVKLRFIQLVLLAGECDADGALVIADNANVRHDRPMTQADVSWRLRVDTKTLADELKILSEAGVITDISGVLTVVNFSERQGRSQSEKREKWRKWQSEHRTTKKNVMHDTALSQGAVMDIESESESVLESDKDKSRSPASPALTSPISQTEPATNQVNTTTLPPEIVQESPGKQHETEKPRPRDLLFDAIAEVTASDIKLLGSRIGKVTAEFRKINATPDQVRRVAAWYSANDWRGKKGEKLTFEILKEVWQQGIRGAPIITSGGKTQRREQIQSTDAERAEAARKAAEHNSVRSVSATERLQKQLDQAVSDRERAEKRKDASAKSYFDSQIAALTAKLTVETRSVPA